MPVVSSDLFDEALEEAMTFVGKQRPEIVARIDEALKQALLWDGISKYQREALDAVLLILPELLNEENFEKY